MRPALLVLEPEPEQAVSIRKLVLETGKFNVLTAHSTQEALEIFHAFPNVSAAVVVADHAVDCEGIVQTIKAAKRDLPVVYLSPRVGAVCRPADYTLSSHEPEQLLNTMRSLFGDPRQMER